MHFSCHIHTQQRTVTSLHENRRTYSYYISKNASRTANNQKHLRIAHFQRTCELLRSVLWWYSPHRGKAKTSGRCTPRLLRPTFPSWTLRMDGFDYQTTTTTATVLILMIFLPNPSALSYSLHNYVYILTVLRQAKDIIASKYSVRIDHYRQRPEGFMLNAWLHVASWRASHAESITSNWIVCWNTGFRTHQSELYLLLEHRTLARIILMPCG